MHVMDRERLLVGGFRIIAMRDVKNIFTNIFLYDKPRAAGEAHAFALADGVEPEAFVLADATTCLEFDDIARVLSEVATDIVVVVDFSQKAVRQEIGLILDRIRTGDKPLQTCLIDLCLGIVAGGNEVVVMSAFFIKRTELDESVAHDIGVGGKACPHLLHRVARNLIPVFAMAVDDLEVAPIFMGHSCRHLEILFRGAVPRFLFLRTNLDIKTIRVEAESGKLIDHHTAIDAS